MGGTGATGATGAAGAGVINWLGAWDSGTTYNVNDAVDDNGSSYIAIATTTNNEPPNLTYWNVLAQAGATGASTIGATGATGVGSVGGTGATGATGAGLTWESTYDPATTYNIDDLVSYQGSSYIAIGTTTGNLPTNATYWDLVAQKGDIGNTGASGTAGGVGGTGATGSGSTGATGASGGVGASGASFVWESVYVGSTAYDVDQVVFYQGSSYICILATTGNVPTNATYWDLMSQMGGTGASGTAGTNGNTGSSGAVGGSGATGSTGPAGATGVSINWTGPYDNTVTYNLNDAVSYNGSAYIAIGTTLAHLPTDPTYWDLMASMGNTGATGAVGNTGAVGASGTNGGAGNTGATGASGSAGTNGSPINWTGAYNGATVYSPLDAVSYNGSSYICILSSTGNLPTNATYWNPLSLEGSQGSTGATGAVGNTGAGTVGGTGATGATGSNGLSLNWTGAYNSGTVYSIDDAVSFNGSSYVCISPTTGNDPTNATYWDLMAQMGATGANGAVGPTGVGSTGATGASGSAGTSINWLGAWSSSTTYHANDAVDDNGSSYICIATNTNQEPPNGTYWNELAQMGATGSPGGVGATGATGVGASGSAGATGASGATGTAGAAAKNAGFNYVFSTTTSSSDPGSGNLRFNNATLASATAFYISKTDNDTNALGAEIATWDDSTSTVRGELKVWKTADPTKFAIYQVTGSVTDNTTWDSMAVTYVTGNSIPSNGDAVTVLFLRTGDAGTAGSNGATGATGASTVGATGATGAGTVGATGATGATGTGTVGATGATGAGGTLTVTNDNAGSLVIGQCVYPKSNGHVDLASANAGQAHPCGFVVSTSITSGGTGLIQGTGFVTATTTQWDAAIGTSGGLTAGSNYFCTTTAGVLSPTAPSSTGNRVVLVGLAQSSTVMLIQIMPPILL